MTRPHPMPYVRKAESPAALLRALMRENVEPDTIARVDAGEVALIEAVRRLAGLIQAGDWHLGQVLQSLEGMLKTALLLLHEDHHVTWCIRMLEAEYRVLRYKIGVDLPLMRFVNLAADDGYCVVMWPTSLRNVDLLTRRGFWEAVNRGLEKRGEEACWPLDMEEGRRPPAALVRLVGQYYGHVPAGTLFRVHMTSDPQVLFRLDGDVHLDAAGEAEAVVLLEPYSSGVAVGIGERLDVVTPVDGLYAVYMAANFMA